MSANDRFAEFLSDSHQLESFFHDFISHVAKRRPKPGTDVTKYAEKLRLSVPAVLKGAKMTWDDPHDSEVAHKEAGRGQTLVFVRPSPADAVGAHDRLHQGWEVQNLPRMRLVLLPHRYQGQVLTREKPAIPALKTSLSCHQKALP